MSYAHVAHINAQHLFSCVTLSTSLLENLGSFSNVSFWNTHLARGREGNSIKGLTNLPNMLPSLPYCKFLLECLIYSLKVSLSLWVP